MTAFTVWVVDPNLESLAAAYGVATSYVDQAGACVEVRERYGVRVATWGDLLP